ncbi:hypothetical protein ACI78Q_19240 [Geodermatophilus sp. SYSU D00705]
MRRPLPALGAVLAAAAVLATPGTAMAGGPLAPGSSQTLDVFLPADWASGVDRLGVTVTGLTQLENGCVEPESESGDRSCGAEEGELADFLDATVIGGTTDGKTCRASATPDDAVTLDLLEGEPSEFDVDGVNCLVLRLEFGDDESRNPDNWAQSDSIDFTLGVVGREKLGGQASAGNAQTTASEDLADVAASDSATSAGSATGSATTPRGSTAVAGAPTGAGTATVGTAVAGGAADGAAAAGGATPAGVPAPADAGTGGAANGPVVGRVDTPVTVDDGGVALATESASTSLAGQVLAWGSLFLGAVVLGGVVFVLARRRRRERAA